MYDSKNAFIYHLYSNHVIIDDNIPFLSNTNDNVISPIFSLIENLGNDFNVDTVHNITCQLNELDKPTLISLNESSFIEEKHLIEILLEHLSGDEIIPQEEQCALEIFKLFEVLLNKELGLEIFFFLFFQILIIFQFLKIILVV